MASSDDFKEQLKAGKIVDALALVLSQAVKLEITTWVASSSDSDIEASSSGVQLSKPGHRLRTNINLVEGKIENEIGSQFTSSGPYRDLRQFHQQQVADSHKIIENNLNSLQQLFGILVKLQPSHPDAPPIKSESSSDISLPHAQDNQWYLEPPESTIEESVAVPPRIDDSLLYAAVGGFAPIPHPETEPSSALTATSTEEDWQDMLSDKSSSALPATSTAESDRQGIVLPPPEVTAPSQSPLNLGADEDWGEWVLEESPQEVPATSLQASNLGTDEDWGELDVYEPSPAVPSQPSLDLGADENWGEWIEESSPAIPATSLEASNLGTDEDWGELDVYEPSPAIPATSLEASNLGTDEDWGELDVYEPSPAIPATSLEASNLGTDEDWGELDVHEPSPAIPATSLETSNLGTDEDWGELDVHEPSPAIPATSLEASNLGTDQDWGELDVHEPSPAIPATSLEASNLGTDQDWGELTNVEPEPFVAEPVTKGFSWAQGIEEHWEEFEVEERELHPATSEAISTELTPVPTDGELEELDALAELLSIDSEQNQNRDYDLLAEELEEGPFAQPSLLHEGIDTPIVFDDSLADLFGESTPELETLDETSLHFSPASANMMTGTQTPIPELYSIEDALFASPFDELPNAPELERSPFDEAYSSFDDSDLLAALDEEHLSDDLFPTDESNVLITPPPSPPSNQSTNQSNQKQGG